MKRILFGLSIIAFSLNALVACNYFWLPQPRATPTLAQPTATRTLVATPTVSQRTSTGRVNQIELLPNDQIRLQLDVDDPAMPTEFTITDWSRVVVFNYWTGLQTPTPVSNKLDVVKASPNHRISVGFYDTQPPTVNLISIHKQEGDQ